MTAQLKTFFAYLQQDKNLATMLRGAGILYVSGAISIGLTFIQQFITASSLGSETFGRFAAIIGIVRLVTLLVDFRTWEAAAKLISRTDANNSQEAASITTWLILLDIFSGSIASLIIVIFHSWIAVLLLKDIGLGYLVLVVAFSIPFTLLATGVPTTIIRLYSRFDLLSAKSILYALTRLVFIGGTAFLGLGLESVIIGFLISEIIQILMLWWMMVRVWHQQHPTQSLICFQKPKNFRQGLKLVGDLWIGASLKGLQLETFIPLLALFTTPAQVGIYRISYDIAQLLLNLIYPLAIVIQPTLIKIYEQESRDKFIRYIKQSVILMSIPVLSFVVIIIFVGAPILHTLLGQEYDNIALTTSILTIGIGVNAMTAWLRPAIVAVNALNEQNQLSFIASVLLIVLLLLLAQFGAVAAASLMTTFFVLYALLSFLVFRKHLYQQKTN